MKTIKRWHDINTHMIVISTNNGKKFLENLLRSLSDINSKIDVSIIDTQSTDEDSLTYLENLRNNNPFEFNIKVYTTPYRGFDSGAYIYAINNIVSDKFYFLQDSITIKSIDFFNEIDKKLKPGVVVPLITFQSNFYANGEQTNFCSSNFGTYIYDKGIFGPMFSILYEDCQKIDKSLLVYPYNKMTQMAMERGWSIIFEKYNFTIDPLEGEKDDRIFNDEHLYFIKYFPYRN